MTISTMAVGELEANCHIVSDAEQHAVLIDPGAEPNRILAYLGEKQLTPVAILLTHAHFDHFGAATGILDVYTIPIYVHTLDVPLLLSAQESLADYLGMQEAYRPIAESQIRTIEEGEALKFSEELTFQVLHTPGHTPGGVCYRHKDVLFTGDTLFFQSVGRVDFPGGNIKDMRASLRRLGSLAGDCTVYCGHYRNTTLAHERVYSPYLIPREHR